MPESSEPARERPPEGRESHGERHPAGWRVRPGPDGRGSLPPQRPRVFTPGLLTFFLLLLVLNIVLTSVLQTQPARVRIPYSPSFLSQVEAGNVRAISSKGATVQGTFKAPVRYPNSSSPPAKQFDTEIPQFANNNVLLSLLQSKRVVINATPPSSGTPLVVTILLSFGPALLIVLLFVWMARRAAGGMAGGIGAFGRSRAQRVEPSEQHVTFDDVAGIDEAKEELSEIVDFLRDPEKYRRLGGPSRAACC